MKIFKQPADLLRYFQQQNPRQQIGFVPTMGALHEGHLTLIKQAKQECEVVVCSIFVNPTQFNNQEDLAKYPRTTEADVALLTSAGCDILFLPEVAAMYPAEVRTTLHFGSLEGKFRAGHFNGVGLVVSKLFHIVKPTKAYFGQKDLQQCLIIKQLLRDYSFDITLIIVPTVRETDGLAMSSRNKRLTEAQRQLAPKIYEALQAAKQALQQGTALATIHKNYTDFLHHYRGFSVEYFEIANTIDLQPIAQPIKGQEIAFVTAVFLGEVRLIDNLVFVYE
jgi:pantoate--beta-alanine ligase